MNAKCTLAVRSQNTTSMNTVASAVAREYNTRTVEKQEEGHTQIDKNLSPKEHVALRNVQQQRFIHQVRGTPVEGKITSTRREANAKQPREASTLF